MLSKIKKVRLSGYDKAWSRLVRTRDGGCLVCGRAELIDAHHFIGRSAKSVRLELENGISLCKSHHVFNHEFSAHRTPKDFKDWFREKYPERAKRMEAKAQTHMTEREAIKEFKLCHLKKDIQ